MGGEEEIDMQILMSDRLTNHHVSVWLRAPNCDPKLISVSSDVILALIGFLIGK